MTGLAAPSSSPEVARTYPTRQLFILFDTEVAFPTTVSLQFSNVRRHQYENANLTVNCFP
jgi:hypothetical protein